MFYGLGDMTDAMEKGRATRDAKRLENARLYNQFASSNPGATTQERLDFANNLIKTTGAGSAGLPTRVQMERSYQEYQAAQARAAAGRARAAASRQRTEAIQNMRLVGDVGTAVSGSWGTSEYDTDRGAIMESIGLPEELTGAIDQAAENSAYQNWSNNSKPLLEAYTRDPTRANFERLRTSAGAGVFGDRITAAYEDVYKANERDQLATATGALLRAAQTSDLDNFSSDASQITLGLPDSVVSKIDMTEYDGIIERRRDEGLTSARATGVANMEAFVAREGVNLTQDSFDAEMMRLIALARAQGYTLDEGDFFTAKDSRDVQLELGETMRANARKGTIQGADGLLNEVLNETKTPEQAYAELETTLRSTNPDYELTDEDRATFSQALSQLTVQREAAAGRAAGVAVLGEDAAVLADRVARGTSDRGAVKSRLEEQLSGNLGFPVTLSSENLAAFEGLIEDAEGALRRNLQSASDIATNTSEVIASTSDETREQFVSQFVAQVSLDQDINRNDPALLAQLQDLANSTYDGIFAQIRSQKNRDERDAVDLVERQLFSSSPPDSDTLGDVRDAIGATIQTTSMLGDGTDEDQVDAGILKDTIITNVTPMIEDAAAQYNIPLTPELASMVMEQFKTANLTVNEQTNFTPGSTIDRSSITSAFEAVLRDYMQRASSDDLPHGRLRMMAMSEAMSSVGAESLSGMTSDQRRNYEVNYIASVKRLVDEEYNLLRETPTEDIAPAQELLGTSENVNGEGLFAVEEFSLFVETARNSVAAGGAVNLDDAALNAAIEQVGNMQGSISNITNEVARLTRLKEADIYAPNPQFQETIQTQIDALRERSASMERHISRYEADLQQLTIAKGQYRQGQALAAEVQAKADEEARTQVLQAEIDAAGPSHRGGAPLGLSPAAEALWEVQNKERIAESNSSFFSTIFGPRGDNDGPRGIASNGVGQ